MHAAFMLHVLHTIRLLAGDLLMLLGAQLLKTKAARDGAGGDKGVVDA
jgi:hypothetical protein